jgi:hypothetical protein
MIDDRRLNISVSSSLQTIALKVTQYPWKTAIDLVQGKEIETIDRVTFTAAGIARTPNNSTEMRVAVESIRGICVIKFGDDATVMRVPTEIMREIRGVMLDTRLLRGTQFPVAIHDENEKDTLLILPL